MTAGTPVLSAVAWLDGAVRLRAKVHRPEQGGPPPSMPAPLQLGKAEDDHGRLTDERRMAVADAVRAGWEEGKGEGLAEGRRLAQKELEGLREAVDRRAREQEEHALRLARSLDEAVASAMEAAEDELVALCLEALARVVGPVLSTPDGVRAQVALLLREQGDAATVTVHVHPDDASLLAGAPDGGGARLRWIADDGVALGGCVVHAQAQTIDARLEQILASCKSAMLATRRSRAQAVGPREGPP